MESDSFSPLLEEGLFLAEGDKTYVAYPNGRKVWFDAILAQYVGQEVQFSMHFLPPNGIQPHLPGAGSCQYPNGEGCPVGHEKNPTRMLSYVKRGVLRASPWSVDGIDGTTSPVPVSAMVNHFGRVAVISVTEMEKAMESLGQLEEKALDEALSASGVQAEELEQMLEKVRDGGE